MLSFDPKPSPHPLAALSLEEVKLARDHAKRRRSSARTKTQPLQLRAQSVHSPIPLAHLLARDVQLLGEPCNTFLGDRQRGRCIRDERPLSRVWCPKLERGSEGASPYRRVLLVLLRPLHIEHTAPLFELA